MELQRKYGERHVFFHTVLKFNLQLQNFFKLKYILQHKFLALEIFCSIKELDRLLLCKIRDRQSLM